MFAEVEDDRDYERRLVVLADAYDRYAVAVRRRWLLRSTAGPLIAEEYDCARATAAQLRTWATFHPLRAPDDGPVHHGLSVTLPAVVGASGDLVQRSVQLVTWPS